MTRIFFMLLAVLTACAPPPADRDPGSRRGPPADLEGCQKACDKLKFFGCNDSGEHAECYASCKAASDEGVELFEACVKTDVCDRTCSTHLAPAPDDGAGGGPGGNVGSGGGDEVSACRAQCSSLSFFSCISVTDLTTCNALCGSAPSSTVLQFVQCVAGANVTTCSAAACYRVLDPSASSGPTPADRTECKDSCDRVAFFDCGDAATQLDCRRRCDSASSAAHLQDFIACTGADPTDCSRAEACLDAF